MRWLGLVALLLFSVGGARGDELDDKARALYQQGEQSFATGHFDEAAQFFEKAYTLSGRPRLLWNIAAAWEKQYQIDGKAEHLRTARGLYQSYAATEGLPEGEREGAGKKIEEIDALLGKPAAATTAATATATATPKEAPRRTWPWVIGGVAAAVAVIGIVVAIVFTRPHDAQAPSTSAGTLTLSFP